MFVPSSRGANSVRRSLSADFEPDAGAVDEFLGSNDFMEDFFQGGSSSSKSKGSSKNKPNSNYYQEQEEEEDDDDLSLF